MDPKRLTRQDILSGRRKEYAYYVEELGGELTLHPLTDGQWAQITAMKSAGGKMAGKPVIGARGELDAAASSANMRVEIDLATSVTNEYEAACLAVAYSLSDTSVGGETWTVADVKRMEPAGVVKKIAAKVYAISGISKAVVEWAESFREDDRGTADSTASLGGVPASADTG